MQKYDNEERMMCLADGQKFAMEEHWIVRARKVDMKLEIMQELFFLLCQGSFNYSFVSIESNNSTCVVDS